MLKNNAAPWSYSKLSTWEKCRRSYKYRYIDKLIIPSGPSAQRGIDVHKACEQFVNGEIDEKCFTDALTRLKCKVDGTLYRYIENLRAVNLIKASDIDQVGIEIKIKVDSDFNITEGSDHFATFIFDVLIQHGESVQVIDYKTGKVYQDAHELQAGIYAYAIYCITGICPTITFLYLDQGTRENYVFTKEDLKDVDDLVNLYLKQIDEETDFPQCADGSNCHWCSYKTLCKGIGSKS